MNRLFDLNCGFFMHITHIDDYIFQTFSAKFKGI